MSASSILPLKATAASHVDEIEPPAEPVAEYPGAAQPAAQPQEMIQPSRSGRAAREWRGRILIVDDVNLVCEGLARLLRFQGIESVSANSADQALRVIEKEDFDLVITDVMMPEINGVEFAETLARTRPGLKCVIITGHATREVITRVASLPNVVDVLTKPVDSRRLIAKVSSFVKAKPPQVAPTPPETAPTAG